MPSSGRLSGLRRRRRERRRRRAARDWADGLPADVLLAILHRLDHIDILMSADRVCRSWRRAAREEPSLWRRITMRGHEGIARKINRCGMACEAVRRAAGQCEAFCGKYAGDDGFLIYLSEQCPCLRSLCLISCNDVTDEGFAEVVQALPLLEELELSRCRNIGADGVYELAGEVCPQLKHFRLNKQSFKNTDNNMDKDALGIASMHGLHSLQLFSNVISNKGIETILDNCLHLEYLDIRHCFNVDMNETLLAKCTKIKTIKLSDDPIDDYDLQAESPGMTVQSPVRTYDYAWSHLCCFQGHNDFYFRHYYDISYPPLLR
ncbi:unnamed protein product [Urochloa decumbens]|uniref:F-box domain-containing protein n=1 Tax=Urochloa decumbens TaxID=240449 RepID=A0ABC9H201_9POAL